MTDTKTFADFDVHPDIRQGLTEAGITTPFPIQEATLPLALAGADVIGQARTGMGKTFAFGVPLLQRLANLDGWPRALVIVPTRELCGQVRDDLATLAEHIGATVVSVYGGRPIKPQADALAAGADVVVGTPGRLLDLLGRGTLTLSHVTTLVLDEADEMLDLGFLPDVEQLMDRVPAERQTMLFSATMPPPIVTLARRYMNKPTFLRIDEDEARIPPDTEQHFFACHRMDKPAVLARILQTPRRGLTLVFTRTKRMADVLTDELRDRSVNATALHSDLRQEARERAMSRFRRGEVDVLVATEVAARGLDISEVSHVVNYDSPDDEKMYLHRIGRTGRAGAAGVAITLGVWNELARLDAIKNALDVHAPTREVYSTSPLLDELFDLPPREDARSRPVAAPPSEPATDAPATDAEHEKPTRRRVRQRSSGGSSASAREQPARRAPARSGEATSTPGPAATPARSGEATSTPGPAATPARSGEATSTPSRSAEPVQDGETVRRRVRTRSRQATREGGTGRHGHEPQRSPSGHDEGPAEGQTQQTPATQGEGKAKSDTKGPRAPQAKRKSKQRKRPGRDKPRSRSGGESASSSPQSQKAIRASTPSGASRNGDPPDVAAARGDGKPELRRPLVVTHLP